MISTVLLLCFTLVAAITDLCWRKIYNWNTYTGILVGLLVSALEPDGIGWEDSLWGFLVCGLVVVSCFLFFPVGGGDVKLIAMMATFLGFEQGLECLLWTFVLGAGMALSILIWRFGVFRLIGRSVKQIWWLVRYQQWLVLSENERKALEPRLRLGLTAFVAVLIVKFGGIH
ncbi:MAG: Type prepilin peptidase TadV/CpaA [Planctomycetaceae bacterium]|nr:Type prepilin peptidase TadV/CpaA [Planctomycetaceae bacterium]